MIIPVRVAGDPNTGLYVAAYDLDAELASVADSFQTYLRVALGALALVGLVASLAAGRLLRPLRLLRDAAASSSNAAELTQRVPVTGNDDVSELAATINSMFDRLQDSAMSQRRLLSDVGHELKTPITIIRGHLELLDAANVAEVEATRALGIDELDRMSTLVSDISLLAASKAPHFVEREVDIESFTKAVGAKASALDPTRTWRIGPASGLALIDAGHITRHTQHPLPPPPRSLPHALRGVQLGGGGVAVRSTSRPIGLNCEVPSSGLCRLMRGGGETVWAAVCARRRARRKS